MEERGKEERDYTLLHFRKRVLAKKKKTEEK